MISHLKFTKHEFIEMTNYVKKIYNFKKYMININLCFFFENWVNIMLINKNLFIHLLDRGIIFGKVPFNRECSRIPPEVRG